MKDTEEGGEMGSIYISSEQIIQEVQKFRCLYDPSHPDHKDRDVMRDAWLSVTQAVVGEPWANLNSAEKNEAVRELPKRWKNIRDAMRKSLNSKGNRRPYIFHEELSFLLETRNYKSPEETPARSSTEEAPERSSTEEVPSKRIIRLLRPKRNTGVVNYSDDTSTAHEADALNETTDSHPAARSPRSKRKKQNPRQIIQNPQKYNRFEREHSSGFVHYDKRMPEPADFSGANYRSSQNTRQNPKFMPEPENPDRLFLLSLLPRVSALSSQNKLDFQIKAMQMLRGFEKDDPKS